MRRFKGLVKSATIVFALMSSALAGRAQAVAPGSHVRIYPVVGTTPSEGSLVIMTSDTITLHIGMSNRMVSMPMDSVRAVDVGEGVRARHGAVLRDTGIGMAFGLGIAVLATKAGCATPQGGDGEIPCDVGYVLLGVPLAIGGAVIGAHIAKNHKSEQWNRVFDRARTTTLLIGPTARHGFAVGLSIPFGGGAAKSQR
jgi:hypothetical protein